MEKVRCPSRYSKDFKRLFHSVRSSTSTNPIIEADRTEISNKGFRKNGFRNKVPCRNEDIKRDIGKNGVSFDHVSNSKTQRYQSPSLQSEKIERLSKTHKISPNKSFQSKKFFAGKRFYGKAGLSPSIFSYPHKRVSPKVFESVLQRKGSVYDLSPFRSIYGPNNVRQGIKLGSRAVTKARFKDYYISGRLFDSQPKSRCVKKSSGFGGRFVVVPRVADQSSEIYTLASKRNRVFGDHMESHRKRNVDLLRETKTIKEKDHSSSKQADLDLERIQIHPGQPELCVFRSAGGSFALSTHTEVQSKASCEVSGQKSTSEHTGRKGTEVVDAVGTPEVANFSKNSGLSPGHGCFRFGLGSADRRLIEVGALDPSSKTLAYKSKGNVCSANGHPGEFRKPNEQGSAGPKRQSNGSILHSKSGRHQILESFSDDGIVVEDGLRSRHSIDSSIHTGNVQHDSGLSVTGEIASRLALIECDNEKNVQNMGYSCDRSVRIGSISGGSELCHSVDARSKSRICKCVQPKLGLPTGMGVSTADTSASSSSAFKQGERNFHLNCPQLGESLLETRLAQSCPGTTHSNSGLTSTPNGPDNRKSTAKCASVKFAGLEDSGWIDQVSNWTEDDVRLLQSAWRPSTLKTYNAPWNNWRKWAKSNSISVNDPSPQKLAAYLGYLHRIRKLSYNSILVNKSVITTFSNPNRTSVLGSHPVVQQMLKAIALTSPVRITKRKIWDIDILIKWLKNNPPRQDSLFQVSRFVAVLLLLASGRRIHDLSLLSIDDDHFTVCSQYIIFWPLFGSKTDKFTSRQSGWKVLNLQNDSLNLYFWIKRLIVLSQHRRGSRKELTCLFISTRGQVRPASKTVMAGWVKSVVQEAGITASPGSIRSAVGSKRMTSNVPIEDILACGNWKNKKNFFKYYLKEIEKAPVDPESSDTSNTLKCFVPVKN